MILSGTKDYGWINTPIAKKKKKITGPPFNTLSINANFMFFIK